MALGLTHYAVGEGEALPLARDLAGKIARNAPLSNYLMIQSIARINDMSTAEGLFTESLAAALSQTTPDAEEGLILTDINTLADGEPRNNFLRRALTWNPDNILAGARHVTLAGYHAYIAADRGIVVVNLDQPLQPRVAALIPITGARATALQFRYLFVIDGGGLRVVDVTQPDSPQIVDGSRVELEDAHRVGER